MGGGGVVLAGVDGEGFVEGGSSFRGLKSILSVAGRGDIGRGGWSPEGRTSGPYAAIQAYGIGHLTLSALAITAQTHACISQGYSLPA